MFGDRPHSACLICTILAHISITWLCICILLHLHIDIDHIDTWAYIQLVRIHIYIYIIILLWYILFGLNKEDPAHFRPQQAPVLVPRSPGLRERRSDILSSWARSAGLPFPTGWFDSTLVILVRCTDSTLVILVRSISFDSIDDSPYWWICTGSTLVRYELVLCSSFALLLLIFFHQLFWQVSKDSPNPVGKWWQVDTVGYQ